MPKPAALIAIALVIAACMVAAAWAILPGKMLPFGHDPDRRVVTQVIYQHKRVRVVHYIHRHAKAVARVVSRPAATTSSAAYQTYHSEPSYGSTPSQSSAPSASPSPATSHTSGGSYSENEGQGDNQGEDHANEPSDDNENESSNR